MDERAWFRRTVVLTLLAGLCGTASAQQVNTFPKRDDPLHVRAAMFDELMRGNHWNEGVMMQHVVFPPAGKETPICGSQEDCPFHTGGYLAGLAFRYAVTKDPKVREYADKTLDGILKLEAVTGQRGCIARSFNKTDKPNWHEKVYFFPNEWHASTAMPGYRWMGDLSTDQFTGLVFGLMCYWELCADDAHKQVAAGFVDRMVGRCVDNNFKIVDSDNKMTLWGNCCPDLPHENFNALLILSHLKTAHRMTGKPRYLAAYERLIADRGYDDEAILAKVLWPEEWRNGSDDHLAAMALYHLMRIETDPSLAQKYRMSLNRHWYLWKDKPGLVFYRMLYQVLAGQDVVGEQTVEAIKGMWGFDRNRRSWTIPGPDGPQTLEAEEEGNAAFMLRDYWFGRYYGIIDPEW